MVKMGNKNSRAQMKTTKSKILSLHMLGNRNSRAQMKTKKLSHKLNQISSLHMLGNRNSRAQMKIQQMMFMLVAVTIFFALVGLIVLSVSLSGMKEGATQLEKENALSLVSKLANSPEFSCHDSFDGVYGECVDADKVIALKENIDDYEDFWGVAGIVIRKEFPEDSSSCSSGNYPNCGEIEVFSKDVNKGAGYSNFVPLCRKASYEGEIYPKCEVARLIIFPEDKTTE